MKFKIIKFSHHVETFSVADDDCYPYEAHVGRCRAKKTDTLLTMNCDVPENRVHEGLFKMGPAYSLNNETDIMWEIFHYGPVQGIK